MDSSTAYRHRRQRWIIRHSYFLLTGLLLMLFQLHAQVLRVVASAEDYPPFYYQQGETLSGFSVEVLQAVATELQLTLHWQRLPWNRMMQHVASGKADVISVFYKNPARASQFYFSNESYYREPLVLLCAQPCPVQYDGRLSSLEQQTIAVVRGYFYSMALEQLQFNRAEVVDSDTMLFKQLLNGRLQLGIASLVVAQHTLKTELENNKIQVLYPALDYGEIFFAFSKQSTVTPAFVAKFDQALQHYKASAAYAALLQRYRLD
ncbi:ABC transporter substrate-binding protein [Rheinheimera sp.]|uniref:substrate-binding periplasmic protein n=1 Tax=Rheinheimera sp. TaxID=1869214 RepID=UPI0027365942|nr:transporter substrate-binding domain-containing protein [Rheinheimera sp.]MDP2714802.1 transporter substrate-binding domain-containing protein [Rheinheimera sp.]